MENTTQTPQTTLHAIVQSPPAEQYSILAALTTPQLYQLQTEILKQYIRGLNVRITLRHAEILTYLLENPPATQKTIAQACGQDLSNTHRRLKSLIKKDLVARAYHQDLFYYHLTIQPGP